MAEGLPLNDALRERVRISLSTFERQTFESTALRRAAVVVGLLEEGLGADVPGIESPGSWSCNASLLLTRRAAGLRNHPGQWALPGGTVDPGESVTQAALRELREEVGLDPGAGQVLGCLDDFATRSGFSITPVVVWIGPAPRIVANESEVASVHRIPLAEFLRTDAPMLETVEGYVQPVLRMPIGSSWIAAPTAAILYQFREVCMAARMTRVAHFEQPLFAHR